MSALPLRINMDISGAMIKLAKKRAPPGRFMQTSFLKAKLPPCVAVTALGECFNYGTFDLYKNRVGYIARKP